MKQDNINTVLVTGGAGYVGNVLVPLLLESNYKVIVYDAMFFYDDTLPNNNNLQIIKGDIRDIKLFESSLKNVDAVIHMACISNDPSFELNPTLGKSINLDAFTPLVEIAKKN